MYKKLKQLLHTSQFINERCKERDRENMKRDEYIYICIIYKT